MNFLSLLINIAFLNPFPNEALCYKIEDHEGKVMEHAVLLHVQVETLYSCMYRLFNTGCITYYFTSEQVEN